MPKNEGEINANKIQHMKKGVNRWGHPFKDKKVSLVCQGLRGDIFLYFRKFFACGKTDVSNDGKK